ncbi:uncharacterized protein LOC105639243 isoform X2 [Jatropha curcas]|uniref:uncharacterized protein LOC105639243 isoform X2 n=1 Tax=Jatropha curcas TaxID=180498 RepID=UPI0005FC2B10|nr:uncharacterized protein LOC105639243 isoform X2 [Jatropha curcas]
MNASPFSNTIEDNNSESDSDANHDVALQHYQPISAVDNNDGDDFDQVNSDEEHYSYSRGEAENGISSLHLNGDVEQKSSSDGEEEEEEERIREASDSAILRAFREDENRRNAPLTAENATRVREGMRGISFGGSAPDWVGRVPEDQWINQLRRLRQPPRPPTSVQ